MKRNKKRESPKEQQEMKCGKSRNRLWYLGHGTGNLTQEKRLVYEVYSSTLVTLTVVAILLLITLTRHLCAVVCF